MTHLKHFIVIRISDSSAMAELAKMVRETADAHPDIPGAETLRKLGSTPLRDPERVAGRLTTLPGLRAVLFTIPGTQTRVLMALGSATMPNLGEDDNAFVALLADTLAVAPVASLWVADFSRLLRSLDYLSDTWRAVRSNAQRVRHGGAVIDTSAPGAELQFFFEALRAASDARSVVQRTTRGKMRLYVDGKCPLRNQSIPTGWKKAKDKTLTRDPDVPTGVIRTIVQVLGDAELTNRQRVEKVAEAGGISHTRSRQLGRTVRIDGLNNPSRTVDRWYELVDVWRTGRWELDYTLPTLLQQTEFDLPIDLSVGDHGLKVWRMSFDLPLPSCGFATDDEFDAAVKLRARRARHETPQGGASPGSVRKPFCGLPSWTHDGRQYKLFSRRAGAYELRSRPQERAERSEQIGGRQRRTSRGWGRTDREGMVVARLSASELHRAVTVGLVQAATEGLQLRTAADQLLTHDHEIVRDLQTKLRAARRRETNARSSANDARTDAERRRFQRDARLASEQAEDLERDLLRMAGSADGELPVDADAVATALAAVADQQDHVDGPVADALRRVISDLRILPDGDTHLRWSACLNVPLAGGVMTIGPATGRIEIGLERTLAARRNGSLADNAQRATRLLMADGLTVEEVSNELGITTTRRVAQTIRDHLKQQGVEAAAARILVAETPAPARRVVWARLNDNPYPADLNQAWAAHTATAYLDNDVRAFASLARAESWPRAAVAAVCDRGGWVPEGDLDSLCDQAGSSRTTLDYYLDGRVRYGEDVPTYLRRVDGGVGLIPCPHPGCDGWATCVSLLPEVTREVLCPDCRRMPETNAANIVFPESYSST